MTDFPDRDSRRIPAGPHWNSNVPGRLSSGRHGSSSTPGTQPQSVESVARQVFHSLLQRGIVTHEFVQDTVEHTSSDSRLRNPADGVLLMDRVLARMTAVADSQVRLYIAVLGDVQRPGENPYRAALRAFKDQVINKEISPLEAHYRAHALGLMDDESDEGNIRPIKTDNSLNTSP